MPISEWERLHREAARYKEMYPKGTRVVLEHMDDPYPAVPPGTRGTVQDVDSIGQIHVHWDNGSGLALVPQVDSFRKMTEEEIENRVPELYVSFGNEPDEKLGGKSPRDYFKAFTDDELIDSLKESVESGVEVSSFLCDEIEARGGLTDKLCKVISADGNDELSTYAVNLLGDDIPQKELEKFVDIITEEKTGESLSEALTELLREKGDEVKEKIIAVYGENPGVKENLIEIMSRMTRDDRITAILCNELKNDEKNLALNAGYVARYGDERALPVLHELVAKDGITYYNFKELKNAIEELGGECEVKFKK